MATQIRPNRLEVSDRFPMLGFTVRTDETAKRYEIAIGTAPELFNPDGKAQRSRSNFYSTRAVGPLPIERGEAVYVLPPEILTRFVGQQKLYYGLATYANGTASGAEVAIMPTAGRAYISLAGLTGRTLQRVRVLPSRQRTASTYGKPNGSEMDWAGDAMAPGMQPAAPAPSKTAPTNGAPPAAIAPAHYDDGYGPLPANQPPAGPARPVPATAPPQSQSMSGDIPLDPGIGGQSIGMDSLEIGDIILSTTDHLVSSVIRIGSGSLVSHAMLYVGQGGQVVEAVGNGVRLIPLGTAINDSTVAVAFRVPGLSPEQRQQIADSIAAYIGRDYNYVGVVRQGLFQMHQRVCSMLGNGARQTCENWMGRIDLGRGNSTEFFCSQLIIQAFADAGLPVTARPPTWNSPQDLAEMFFRDGALTYVGHLKAPPASRSLLDVFGLSMATGMSAAGVEPRYRRGSNGVARSQGVMDWASSRVADAIREAFRAATKRPFSFPPIRMLGEAESQTVRNALQSSIFRNSISGIQSLLSQEYSLGIGVSAGGGAGVGAGAGAGVIFTSDGHFGVYGDIQVAEGIFEAISANVRITVVRGGVDAFNGPSVSAGVELGLEIVGSLEVLGDDRGNIQGISIGVGAGEQAGVFFSQGIGWAVQLFAERTVPARIMRVRAMDADLQPAQLPAARRLSGWEKTLVRGAIDAVLATAVPPVSVALPALIRLVNEEGYSVGIGLGGDAGLLGGGGIGFGIILAPGGDVGVFGSVEIRAGLLAGLSAGARVIVVHGGIETFNETGYTVGVTVEAEASVSVMALFNSQRQFHGVSFQLGVGAALSPIQIFTATERSVSTAVTQSLGIRRQPLRVRAMDADLQPAQLPTARRLSGWEKTLVRGAIDAVLATAVPPVSVALPALIRLVNEEGHSVGIGLGGDAGLLGGGGIGFGIILAPNDDIGVFGSVEIRAGLLAGLSAGARVIVVHGGIETFNETGYTVGVTVEAEASVSVMALFNSQRQFHGVSFQLGVGAALSPIQIFTATERSVSTAVTQSLGMRTQRPRVRAMDTGLQPAQLPTARRLSGWEKTVVRGGLDVVLATAAPPVSIVLPELIRMVNELGYSVGLGLGGDAGLLGGAGIGFGVILAPNDDIGVFGSVEIRAGLLAGLSAGARVIVVRGGIDAFNETGYAVGVTVEVEASVSVMALFNSQRQFHGVSFQLGVGAALSPIQIFTATERSVSTAVTQSLAADGDDQHGIDGPIPDGATTQGLARFMTVSPEYPQASRFEPADSSNFRAVSGARAINRIVIHITDGGANISGTISWFKNPAARVSAHYVVGQDGEVVQMVRHNDVAWHARSANGDSIGIEHVANTRGLNPTDAQYCASAALANWLAQQFSIPMDRTHILGHSEADPGTTHTGCPNAVWDWTYYMGMVASATCYARPTQTQSLAMRLPAPPPKIRTARMMDAAGRMIGSAPVNTVTGGEGNVTWDLDQFPGMKMASAAAAAPPQSAETIELVNWPFCPYPDGSRASAWFKVDWKFSGQALGAVQITAAGTQAGAQPLRVEARIEDGRNRDASTVSLVVRFTYRFSTAEGMEQRAVTELTLFSDGTLEQQSRWIAQAAA